MALRPMPPTWTLIWGRSLPLRVRRKPRSQKKKRKRKIEVFVSMCSICFDAIDLVNSLVGPDDEVTVLDVERSVVADRARELDILSVPCVVIDGAVAGCCQKGFPYEWDTLKNAGLGQPLPKT